MNLVEKSTVPPGAIRVDSRRTCLRVALAAWAGFTASGGLAGCAASPVPQLLRLRSEPPSPAPPAAASNVNWQLMLPVRLPDYLNRDALLLPQGQSGLAPLAGYRWAEPLSDSLPRLLRADLASLLGEGRVWTAPLPPGLAVQRQLRVEVMAFEAAADRSSVSLRARWSVADTGGASVPRAEVATLVASSDGADADSLVVAHRLALWRLAERIAASG
jgi:uncharacterized lipoprotein YmbA